MPTRIDPGSCNDMNGLGDEFHKLEQSFTQLADNEQWVTDHHDQILHAADHAGEVTSAAEERLSLAMTGDGDYQPLADLMHAAE
jgi:hypothetical protein